MPKKPHPKKVPKFDLRNRPDTAKEPRIGVSLEGATNPVWRFSHMDWDGPWCPSKCKDSGIREVLARLANFESMSWQQIHSGTGSHVVDVTGIIKEARDRIIHLKKEEWADNLCSLRMCGKERLWGFLRSGIFHLLWWDPEHQVFPSKKKNT